MRRQVSMCEHACGRPTPYSTSCRSCLSFDYSASANETSPTTGTVRPAFACPLRGLAYLHRVLDPSQQVTFTGMSDLALAAAFAAGQQPAAEAYAPQRRAAAPNEPMEEEMGELPTIDDLEVAAAAAGVAPVPPLLAELGYFELGPAPEAMKEDDTSSEEDSSSSEEGARPGYGLELVGYVLAAPACFCRLPIGMCYAGRLIPAYLPARASFALQRAAVMMRMRMRGRGAVPVLPSDSSCIPPATMPSRCGSCCCRSRGQGPPRTMLRRR